MEKTLEAGVRLGILPVNPDQAKENILHGSYISSCW